MAEINETTNQPAPTTRAEMTVALRRRRSIPESQDTVPFNAVARSTPERLAKALERASTCARIADDNRAKDILLLDLREATPLVDYFMIATANSRRQSNAIAEEIDQEMKRLGEHKLGMEGSEEGRWFLIDYGDFVVHIFSGEARTYYALEEIWGDAPRLDWQDPTRPLPVPEPSEEPAEGSA
jgi:ribosome-associated protein